MLLLNLLLWFCLTISDIQFWRSRKTLEGLSVRSVFFNVFQSVIVLLYVMDNETNTVVIISCFVGLIIEIWKINKAVDIKVREACSGIFLSNALLSFPYSPRRRIGIPHFHTTCRDIILFFRRGVTGFHRHITTSRHFKCVIQLWLTPRDILHVA